jgi:error-prone DNA polymerase
MPFLPLQRIKLCTMPAELVRIADGRWVRLAGLVLLRQRPSTAKGVTFVTLEDETGIGNLIIRQEIWERYRRPACAATAMLASARLQKHAGVIHLLTEKIEDLSTLLAGLRQESRDFR